MIRRQRQNGTSGTTVIRTDGVLATTPEEITNTCTWVDYFQKLATPSNNTNFSSEFQQLVDDDIAALTEIFENNRNPMSLVTVDEVKKCLMSFKMGRLRMNRESV